MGCCAAKLPLVFKQRKVFWCGLVCVCVCFVGLLIHVVYSGQNSILHVWLQGSAQKSSGYGLSLRTLITLVISR